MKEYMKGIITKMLGATDWKSLISFLFVSTISSDSNYDTTTCKNNIDRLTGIKDALDDIDIDSYPNNKKDFLLHIKEQIPGCLDTLQTEYTSFIENEKVS